MEVDRSEEELQSFHIGCAKGERAEHMSQTVLSDALEGVADAWREREAIE